MRKILCVFAFVALFFGFSQAQTTDAVIEKVSRNFIYVRAEKVPQDTFSGVIVRDFGPSKSIIAKANVVAKEDEFIKFRIVDLKILEQNALPKTDVSVKAGDKIIFNYLYDRGLIIAPSEADYERTKELYPHIKFSHPDLLGAYLIRAYQVAPQRSTFEKFCSDNALGVVAFVLRDRIRLVDCYDFLLIDEKKIMRLAKSPQAPFYSRIKGYRQGLLNLFSESRINYYRYYRNLSNAR